MHRLGGDGLRLDSGTVAATVIAPIGRGMFMRRTAIRAPRVSGGIPARLILLVTASEDPHPPPRA